MKNHKIFLSVGHDEYWSGAQRANVEAARDAGVNLAFFSGNEVYWRTRWENSVDGSGTPYRTLVCYKETWADAKIDPSDEWTGTFRDMRFAADATEPENSLTGTITMTNYMDAAIEVPAEQGRMRLWRNTSVATLLGGQVATLAPHSLGYESDEDLDNGYRPAGLIRLSVTEGESPQLIRDFGRMVVPGTTTHHLTLYRARSGALVFATGTIQWAWGLDPQHDGIQEPADPRMQQATVNLFADMGVQPATLMRGLVPATQSTDRTPPSAAVTWPRPTAVQTAGSQVTIQGSAADTGDGKVAGVEVSTDGGETWHPAVGTTLWSYTFTIGRGPVRVLARATDDSANLGPVSPMVTLRTAAQR
ncbi:N,N-dimethylformamidase beta subunit family domain-containing protein [Luedemannella flava]